MLKNLKFNRSSLPLAFAAVLVCAGGALAQTTSFTYQGKLTDGGTPANGSYDLQFALWDSAAGGGQNGSPQTLSSVPVSGGSFTVTLDFGVSAFPGANRFLEIGVRPAGSGNPFTLLSPRQQITSTPYAVRSLNAASADSVPVNALPAGNGNYIQNTTTLQSGASFNISGNGTAGGTLSGNVVNSETHYNLGSNSVLSVTGSTLFPNGNTFVGVGAGASNAPDNNFLFGNLNSFFGQLAGNKNQTGNRNSFFGAGAGQSNTTGASNSFFGNCAGCSNMGGIANSFFGDSAGQQTTGAFNSFFGDAAGVFNTTGLNNTFIGYLAGSPSGTQVSFSTAIGSGATVSTDHTIVLGTAAENVVVPGTGVGIGTFTPKHHLAVIGGPAWTQAGWAGAVEFANASAMGWQSNTAGWHFGLGQTDGGLFFFQSKSELGTTSNPAAYIMTLTDGGFVGIGTTTPNRTLEVNGRARIDSIPDVGTNTRGVCFNDAGDLLQCDASSLRFKTNVHPFHSGLDIIRRLRPISFDWKDGSGHDIGLGAEDVAKAAPSFTFNNREGQAAGVKYERLNLLLINAVKEQQEQIEALRTANAALNARLRAIEKSLRLGKRGRQNRLR